MCANRFDWLGSEFDCSRFKLGSDPESPGAGSGPDFGVVRLNRGFMVGKQALTMAMQSSTIVQILTGTSDPVHDVRLYTLLFGGKKARSLTARVCMG